MSVNKKIILIGIIILLSSFSGCTLFNRTEFSLKSLNITDENGFVTMTLKFNISDKVTVKLINPGNTLLFQDDFFKGTHDVHIYLSEYRTTPPPGTYTVKAYDNGKNVLFQKKLTYTDQNLAITTVHENWWREDNKYSLVGFSVVLHNQGDLPAYPYSADVYLNNEVISGFFIPTAILPQQSKSVYCFAYMDNIPEIKHVLRIAIKDTEEFTIAETLLNVLPSENVSELTFRWRYKTFKSLVLPNVPYFYTHYTSLERIDSEDYAAYVFDRYDDQYIDLVAKRLLLLIDSSKDVEIINYIASFVQDLTYVEDTTDCDYPRYPYELLQDAKGDCEDKAILTAAILDSLGYNVSLLKLPNHVAVGVHLGKSATSYEYYINSYYFLETTSSGWILGKVPPEHKDQSNVTAYPVSIRPLLIHSWENATRYSTSDGDDYVELTILLENLGRKPAVQSTIWGAFYNQSMYYNQKETPEIIINEDTKQIIEFRIDVPQSVSTKLKTHIHLNNKIVHTRESASNFP
jgi:predicted transglutaminase-like cysteine proteinase